MKKPNEPAGEDWVPTWEEMDPDDLAIDLKSADRRNGDRMDTYYQQVAHLVVRATMPGARPAPGKELPTLAITRYPLIEDTRPKPTFIGPMPGVPDPRGYITEDATNRERYHRANNATHGGPRISDATVRRRAGNLPQTRRAENSRKS